MSRFRAGIDFTEDNRARQYVAIDGKHFYFTDAREANELGIALISIARHFIHPTLYDPIPGDRQVVRLEK